MTSIRPSAAEKAALWALVDEVKAALDEQLHPDGYDVGFKTSAGQTLLHAHVDVIPRLPRREERQPSLATGGERDPLAVDRVVMLRPTESPIVFLQQLGRGLRNHEGKHQLTVIDFVGNHRIFLARIRRLLSLVASLATDVQRSLEQVVRMTARGSGRRPYSPGACRRSLPYVFAAPRIDAPDGARITRA